MSQEDIQTFIEEQHFGEPVSEEEFKRTVKNAYMDRARQVWFIYKKMTELYPDIDAKRIIREGSWDFGAWQGRNIAKEQGGAEHIGPREALLGQTSKGGMLVFEQEILQADETGAVKNFCACPHVEAIRDLGASESEIRSFCRDMIGACDYAIVSEFPRVGIDFPTTIADGEGKPCRMTITPKLPE